MRRVFVIIGLEVYALLLAGWQMYGHVRTDEAKYLLNIPYPHPPLARSILQATEWLPVQELFWRAMFATLLIQAVWLVWYIAPRLQPSRRVALAFGWLLSAAVIFQAGSIMMAPLTALQGLVFVFFLLRTDIDLKRSAGWVALFWLVSLFTAYQAVLYAPVVWTVLRRTRISFIVRGLCFLVPVGLVGLYALSNPLSLASFVLAGGGNAAMTLSAKLSQLLLAAGAGGSVFFSLAGVLGMLRMRAWALLASLILVCAFVFVSYHGYYAILFTPLFVGGTALLLRKVDIPQAVLLVAMLVGLVGLHRFAPLAPASDARRVVRSLDLRPGKGALVLFGSFGHEWQYESPVAVRRYAQGILSGAQAVVCTEPCPDLSVGARAEWTKVQALPVDAWIRSITPAFEQG